MTQLPHSYPQMSRGEGRPVPQRTRTFRPNYLSFAGTYQCNLTCPHCCVPIEWTDRLDIPTALRFLDECHDLGIKILGFTGGEPFLYPEFLEALTRRAVELGFSFDKLMTNGLWYRDEDQLVQVLERIRDAGFSGKIGLSVDKFHGVPIERLAIFCRAVRRIFDRDNILSLSYASRSVNEGLEPARKLAQALDAVIDWSPLLNRYMLVSDDFTMTLNWNHLATVERAEKLPGNPWDGEWFEEDYCEGPGQALIVNPRGEVKPCCGFASDLDQLTIGNIYRDSAEQIVKAARKHPVVGKIFRKGLSSLRDDIFARDPSALPGATSNHCFFCWHVLTKNLVELPTAKTESNAQTRVSLPLADASAPDTVNDVARLLMAFDGKTVYLGEELPRDVHGKQCRVWLIRIQGPVPPETPPSQQSWSHYQAWIDRLRADGYTLTTHSLSPCQK